MTRPAVILGISGGIAAYKSAMVASQLAQEGIDVQAVLTGAGQQFITPTTLAALTGRPVATDTFDPQYPLGPHIELAAEARLLCVAPATANFLAKAAAGSADDLLSTLYLCFRGPVIMAPAMNSQMWEHVAVQRNVGRLAEDGVQFVGPESGWLSCRQEGPGRMAAPEAIVAAIRQRLTAAARPAANV